MAVKNASDSIVFRSMLVTDSSDFNHKIVGRTGIALAVFQILTATVGFFIFIFTITTPEFLLGNILHEFFGINLFTLGGLFFFRLILLMFTIGLTIGVYRQKVGCAYLLLLEVASYPMAALFGWLFLSGRFTSMPNIEYLWWYAAYIGVLLVFLLFTAYGIWGRSKQASASVKFATLGIIIITIVVPVIIVKDDWSHKGSIMGNIYKPGGTVVTEEVTVFCAPLDPNIHITHGDPAPPALSVKVNGEYKIDNLPAGKYAVLAVASTNGFFPEKPVIVKVTKMENINQDLILVTGGTITGRVVGIEPAMTQLKPFTVQCSIEPEGLSWSYFSCSTLVADDGSYLLENVAPGNIRIYVNNGSYQAQSAVVVVKSGEQTIKDFSILK